MKVKTLSGRYIDPPPKIRYPTTHRKALNDLKKRDKWLLEEGIKEAESRKDEFVFLLFSGIQLNNMSSSDKSSLSLYLFGDEYEIPRELISYEDEENSC